MAGVIGPNIVPIRSITIILLLLSITACTSKIMLLQTSDPSQKKYHLLFGKQLIDYDHQAKSIEVQLNEILQSDENTHGCSLVPNSINFGEPGSQGTALVECKAAINLAKYESTGGFHYYYKLLENSGDKPAP